MLIHPQGVRPVLVLVASVILGCASIAIDNAPAKKPIHSTTSLAREAREEFWQAFGGNQYERVDSVIENLTSAYVEQPADPDIALLLAHAHFWKGAERSRVSKVSATITDEFLLTSHYLSEAKRLRPDDGRIDGWLGGVRLALGQIHADEKLTRTGYFQLQDAKSNFPEFNGFSASFAMASLPPNDPKFGEVVEDMWTNMDLCAGESVSHADPSYVKYMPLATKTGPKRVCWNSDIAPHNFEGFFLHFGDVVSKAGDGATARRLYENAKLSPTYASWPYRGILEKRVTDSDERARRFREPDPAKWPEMMTDSAYACTGCHARSGS